MTIFNTDADSNDRSRRWWNEMPLSPRSQRALQEAVLDWRHEASNARNRIAAVGVHCRGTVGVLRVLAEALVVDTRTSFSVEWLVRYAAWMAILVAAFLQFIPSIAWNARVRASFDPFPFLLDLALAISRSLSLAMSLSVLTGRRNAASPVLAYTTMFAGAASAMSFMVMPWLLYFAGSWKQTSRMSWISFVAAIALGVLQLSMFDRARQATRRVRATVYAIAAPVIALCVGVTLASVFRPMIDSPLAAFGYALLSYAISATASIVAWRRIRGLDEQPVDMTLLGAIR